MPRACASFASRASLAAFCAPLAKFAFLAFAGVAFCLAAVCFAFVFLDGVPVVFAASLAAFLAAAEFDFFPAFLDAGVAGAGAAAFAFAAFFDDAAGAGAGVLRSLMISSVTCPDEQRAGQRRRLTYSALILELMIPNLGGRRMRTGRRTCLQRNGMTLESSD